MFDKINMIIKKLVKRSSSSPSNKNRNLEDVPDLGLCERCDHFRYVTEEPSQLNCKISWNRSPRYDIVCLRRSVKGEISISKNSDLSLRFKTSMMEKQL